MAPKHSLSQGYQSRTVAEPVKEILFFLAAIRTGGILRRIKSLEVLLERRYCFRTSSCPLLICFASRETLRCLYTEATRSCIGGVSQIVSLMTWIELDREIGRIVSVAMVVASLAALSARSLSGMAEWPGIYWMKMDDQMELMELWMENVRGWDEMRVSQKDLLSVQKSMVVEWWLMLVSFHDSADSMAAVSSS